MSDSKSALFYNSHGYSEGTTGPESTRFAATAHPSIAQWGVAARRDSSGKEKNLPRPHSGLSFLRSFPCSKGETLIICCTAGGNKHDEKPSSADAVLVTDRQWSTARASTFIVKGTLDLEPVRAALAKEGLSPVPCHIDSASADADSRNQKALASIWVNEIEDSVCGTYHEYVVSFDVRPTTPTTGKVEVVQLGNKTNAAYACWYNNFGSDICHAQFLHSLYINSPLSIAWGRQMQAFPKHPTPVLSNISLEPAVLSSSVKWSCDGDDDDDDCLSILEVTTHKRFGALGFLRQAAGLLGHLGLRKVSAFWGTSVFCTNIVMPARTAQQNKCGQEYVAHLWKGWHPTAVQVWPWNPATDRLALGSATNETGCEDNNGIALLKAANFEPLSVCRVEKLSAVVTARDSVK